MPRRLFSRVFFISWLAFTSSVCSADERVRIATYNIQFLNANISASRAAQLKDVISALDADIMKFC